VKEAVGDPVNVHAGEEVDDVLGHAETVVSFEGVAATV
jgi:hypothetical protein